MILAAARRRASADPHAGDVRRQAGAARADGRALLLACEEPRYGDFLVVNTRTGGLIDGNGRAHELQRRAGDPRSKIRAGTTVRVERYEPDLSMFLDL